MAGGLFHAERIFDGTRWHDDASLRVNEGRVVEILRGAAAGAMPVDGWIAPGLIDLQVNGGGGVLFNNDPSPAGIAAITAAHAGFGTTSVMVTLITDRPAVTTAAIAAARGARAPGFLGLHLEGPHLDPVRKGTHDPDLIRPMTDDDLAHIRQAARDLPHLICTVAPEAVTLEQVRALAGAGVVVSLGHSDCTLATARAYAGAGARMVTHLFNAMSPLGHRAPGLVGAALDDARLSAGLIADGFHVADAALGVALRAKVGTVFLVSDAMSTVGSDLTGLVLNGRQIFRAEGRLTLADGTLAGADIALIDAVRHLHQALDLPVEAALRLASAAPAAALGLTDRGHLRPGARADFIALSPGIRATATWIGGRHVA
ncbi:N-acetylglucosamine-6-phosphate deacetylase [bacterium]|nr:N-acetylglucosamine-6-phosphate deacetylase [bacterium]